MNGGKETVSKLGLGKNYSVGSNLSFAPSEGSYYLGYKQRVELFSVEPGSGFYFYFVPLSKSHIKYAYFTDSEKIKRYGDIVNLKIALHGYNLEKDVKYKAKLYLLEEEKAVGLTETKQFKAANLWEKAVIVNITDTYYGDNWNAYINHSFPIEIEWRKNQSEKKNFTVVLEIYKTWIDEGYIYDSEEEERVDYRNFADKPTNDLVNYDANVLGLQDLDDKPSISSRFIVSEELMDDYLSRIELQKTNMIQYIGDIRYNKREFDPCGYSKITIKDEDDKERDSMVIFNEEDTENPIDQTAKVFTIITGDARKNISITLDKLKNKGQFCQGVLLEKGQKHTDKKNIFQLDRVMPALRMQDGNFVVVQDTTQKDDYDAVPDEERGASGSASDAQEWKEGVDYKIDSDDKMTLMPRYLYNKTSLEGIQNYTSHGIPNEALNTLWLFNYFVLNDNLAQTYFVPISTCRYPNQIAKFKVYPDIEWEIAFLVTIGAGYSGKIKYERERLNGYYRDSNRNFGFKYLKDDLKIDVTQSSNLGWSIMGKCAVSGKEHSLGFEGIKRSVDLLVTTFNASREVLEVLNPAGTNPAESAAVSKKVIEVDFAIDPPNIGFALSKKFGEASNKEIVPIYKGGFRGDPFIGITISVDLVQVIGRAGLIGKIINWIIEAIAYITDSEIYITFEAGLAVKFDFTLSYNRIDGLDGKNEGQQVITVEVPISIKAGCKSEGTVLIPAVTRGGRTYPEHEEEKWKVEGKLSTTFTFTKTYGYDKDKGKQYEQSKGIWNPAEITITCYNMISSKIKPTKSEKFKLFDEKTLFDNPKTYTDEKK